MRRCVPWLGVLRKISFWYVTLFRGTPLFVQIVIWAYVWFPFFVHPADGVLISGEAAIDLRRSYGALIAGSLALIANSGAYICEIFRAGIQSIDKGQMEAARSLGLTYTQAMRYVILPQALRRMLPPLASEFITLLKDSSLLSVIGVAELAYVQSTITGRYSVYEEPLYTIALIYLVLTSFFGLGIPAIGKPLQSATPLIGLNQKKGRLFQVFLFLFAVNVSDGLESECFADFDTACDVFRRCQFGGRLLGGLEFFGCHDVGSFLYGQCVGHVLPTCC